MPGQLPRERLQTALAHKEPDCVPVDFGGWQSGISYETYEPLKKLIKIDTETVIAERVQGLARIDDELLKLFHVDTRYVFTSTEAVDNRQMKEEDSFVDAWGIEWKRPKTSHYYDIAKAPLQGKKIEDIKTLSWPTAETFLSIDGIRENADREIRDGYSVFTCLAGVFEQSTYVRGMNDFYMDIAIDAKFFEATMDRVLESLIDVYTTFFNIFGDRLDVVQFWCDLGTQRGPLISPEIYRKYIKPREAALINLTKKMTNAKVALHTCGGVYEIIPDIIDAGYDVLNPVQTTAIGMEPSRLKREFGKDLVFWGAIDTQRVLPFGTIDEVRDEVKAKIDILAPGGGYIFAPCHNIQANTPPENVLTMFETAIEHGS